MPELMYFAYGSNMCTRRLCARVPCTLVGAAALPGHALRFHKRGRDGSGKCNALHTGHAADRVFGVVFAIDAAHKHVLDRIEGVGAGYHDTMVEVAMMGGAALTAWMYEATAAFIDDTLRPFTWYRAFVVGGARQHGLPTAYIRQLAAVEAHTDPDHRRASDNARLLPCGEPSAVRR
jgi:hypothetical protein